MDKIKVKDNLPNLKAKRQAVTQIVEKEALRNKRPKNPQDNMMTKENPKWSISGYSLRPKVW